jgi:uncharacterized protein (TIGR02996 family)
MSTDTGAALTAAIRAAPDDDAPWLVYADWLREAGRDAEAQAVRSHLPALRPPVRAGHDVAEVVATAARHPPGDPLWELAFGRPPAPPVGFPAQLPSWRDPSPRTVERGADRRAPGTDLRYLLVPVLIVLVSVLRAMAPRSEPLPDALRLVPPKASGVTFPPPKSATRWDRDQVAGHTFCGVGKVDEAVVYVFGTDGDVTVTARLADGSPLRMTLAWKVDDGGAIQITAGPAAGVSERWGRGDRLVLLRVEGNRYDVERNGRPEVYIRD